MEKPAPFQRKADHYARAFAPAHGKAVRFDKLEIGDTFRFQPGQLTTLYRKTADGEYVDEPGGSLHVGRADKVYLVRSANQDK
jgi:hypothetical protein